MSEGDELPCLSDLCEYLRESFNPWIHGLDCHR